MILPYELDEPYKNITLYPKKSVSLGQTQVFPGKDIIDKLCNKEDYPKQPEEDETHYYTPPSFLKHTLDEVSNNYKIVYYRYDDKMVSWKFPDRWWRNLGKKLWG